MSGGPLYPESSGPDTSGSVFPWTYYGQSNARAFAGMGVTDSLGSCPRWHQEYSVPACLPTGTPYLQLKAVANAAAGSVAFDVLWVPASTLSNFDTLSLTAEGSAALIWTAADQILTASTALDASGFESGCTLVLDVKFLETSDLAAISTWQSHIKWE